MDPFLRCFLFKKGIVHCHSFLWFLAKSFFIVEKFFNLKTFSQVGTVDEKRHDNRGGQLDRLDNSTNPRNTRFWWFLELWLPRRSSFRDQCHGWYDHRHQDSRFCGILAAKKNPNPIHLFCHFCFLGFVHHKKWPTCHDLDPLFLVVLLWTFCLPSVFKRRLQKIETVGMFWGLCKPRQPCFAM